jgi:hypothetical protein
VSVTGSRAADRARTIRGAGPTRRLLLPLLAGVPGLAHAFTLRGAEPRAALREAAGRDLPLRELRQVHGARVVVVDGGEADAAGAPLPEGDALATRARGVALAVAVADCLPILVCDPEGGALAAVHAGWRGTARGVLRAALDVLCARLGARPDGMRVAFGPGIGPCCFEVGDEVVEALLRCDAGAGTCVAPGPRPRVDLVGVNRRQALAAGVPPGRIESAGWCTRCSPDLASYRRDREAAGRMAGLIAWRG